MLVGFTPVVHRSSRDRKFSGGNRMHVGGFAKWPRLLSAFLFVPLLAAVATAAEERTWTDTTGKFNVSAALVQVEGGVATLRRSDGQELSVPLEKLSDADRKFIAAQPPAPIPAPSDKPADKTSDSASDKATDTVLAGIATRFYSDLRTTERTVARQSLTKKAESLMSTGPSPLAGLPQPQAGDKAIRVGSPKCEGNVAEIPVVVRAGGAYHKTKLHLRKDSDDWRVFAISAVYPDGEKSINFEASQLLANVDPLKALLGKQLDIESFKVDGKKLDMSQFKGKVVLVDFWATWCGPCREEIPNIRENWAKHHEQGFDVIAISVDQDLRALGAFVAEEKPPWTVVADNYPGNRKPMDGRLGIRSIPAFILIGKDGNVAAVNCRGPQLGQQLDKLLANN
jgi:thiol-disulfide isomerase/thioredoxin